MKPEKPAPLASSLGRREFVQATTAAAVAAAASGVTSAAAAQGGKIEAQEHWAKKGNVDVIVLSGDGDIAKQSRDMDSLIAKKVNIILVCSLDGNAIVRQPCCSASARLFR